MAAGARDKTAPGELALVQQLVNTSYGQDQRAHRELTTPDELQRWLVGRGLLGAGAPVTAGDLRRTVALREALRALLQAHTYGEAPPAEAVATLNLVGTHAPLVARFGEDGAADLAPDIGGVDGALARLLGIVVRAMLDGSWPRLKACAHARCASAFYDTSKNASGKWCAMAKCGNRLNARAYRRRKRPEPARSDG
ncbi:MAG TPA: CGNR zinc finger domain-containing protein [Chloroflexota bacterium]|nr:CGNR zinc finger domain-containing protein [Chloroflexota bacterium]